MAAKNRDTPELWERQPGERIQHYQRFCMYRDMPYGMTVVDQGSGEKKMQPQKRSIRGLAKLLGLKAKTTIEGLSAKNNWVERAAAYDVYRMELERFSNEQAVKKMHDIHAQLGVQLLTKATRGLTVLKDEELSAQDIARLADVGVKIERLSRGDSTENTAVSGKVTAEHTGKVEMTGAIPDMSSLTDQELEELEQILGKLHPQQPV